MIQMQFDQLVKKNNSRFDELSKSVSMNQPFEQFIKQALPPLGKQSSIQTYKDYTALMIATRVSNIKAIEKLMPLESNYINNYGYGAINIACRYSLVEPFKILSSTEKELLTINGQTPLMVASYYNSIDIIQDLLYQVGRQDIQGNTALMYAAIQGNYIVVEKIINYCNENPENSELKYRNKQGYNALELAIQYSQLACIEQLQKYEQISNGNILVNSLIHRNYFTIMSVIQQLQDLKIENQTVLQYIINNPTVMSFLYVQLLTTKQQSFEEYKQSAIEKYGKIKINQLLTTLVGDIQDKLNPIEVTQKDYLTQTLNNIAINIFNQLDSCTVDLSEKEENKFLLIQLLSRNFSICNCKNQQEIQLQENEIPQSSFHALLIYKKHLQQCSQKAVTSINQIKSQEDKILCPLHDKQYYKQFVLTCFEQLESQYEQKQENNNLFSTIVNNLSIYQLLDQDTIKILNKIEDQHDQLTLNTQFFKINKEIIQNNQELLKYVFQLKEEIIVEFYDKYIQQIIDNVDLLEFIIEQDSFQKYLSLQQEKFFVELIVKTLYDGKIQPKLFYKAALLQYKVNTYIQDYYGSIFYTFDYIQQNLDQFFNYLLIDYQIQDEKQLQLLSYAGQKIFEVYDEKEINPLSRILKSNINKAAFRFFAKHWEQLQGDIYFEDNKISGYLIQPLDIENNTEQLEQIQIGKILTEDIEWNLQQIDTIKTNKLLNLINKYKLLKYETPINSYEQAKLNYIQNDYKIELSDEAQQILNEQILYLDRKTLILLVIKYDFLFSEQQQNEQIKQLLQLAIDQCIKSVDKDGHTALFYSVRRNNKYLYDLLYDKEIEIQMAQEYKENLSQSRTLLMESCLQFNKDITNKIIQQYQKQIALQNQTEQLKSSMFYLVDGYLHQSYSEENNNIYIEIFNQLVQQEQQCYTSEDDTIIEYSLKQESITQDKFNIIYNNFAGYFKNVKSENNHITVLMLLAKVNYYQYLQDWIEQQINLFDKEHKTATMYAIENNSTDSIDILLGKELKMVDNKETTSLMYLVKHQQLTQERLTKVEQECQMLDSSNYCAFHYACMQCYEDGVQLLVKYEANINMPDNSCPINPAVKQFNEKIIQLLTPIYWQNYNILINPIKQKNIKVIKLMLDTMNDAIEQYKSQQSIPEAVDSATGYITPLVPHELSNVDEDGMTDLMLAIQNQLPDEIIQRIIDYDSCVYNTHLQLTSLQLLVQNDNFTLEQKQHYANMLLPFEANYSFNNKNNPLMMVCEYEANTQCLDSEKLNEYYQSFIKHTHTAVNSNGYTALHIAASNKNELAIIAYCQYWNQQRQNNNFDIVLTDFTKQTKEELTALMICSQNKLIGAAKALAPYELSITTNNNITALDIACRSGCIQICNVLMEEIELLGKNSQFLMQCIKWKNLQLIEEVVKSNNQLLKQKNTAGKTALMLSVTIKWLDGVKALAEVEGKETNDQGETALMLACFNRFYDAVSVLAPYEAGMVKQDNYQTALMILARLQPENEEEQDEIVNAAKNLLSEANKQDVHGMTAIAYASISNNYKLVQLLIDKEAGKQGVYQGNDTIKQFQDSKLLYQQNKLISKIQPQQRKNQYLLLNNSPKTSLMYAAEFHNIECVKILINYEKCAVNDQGYPALFYVFNNWWTNEQLAHDCFKLLKPFEKEIQIEQKNIVGYSRTTWKDIAQQNGLSRELIKRLDSE